MRSVISIIAITLVAAFVRIDGVSITPGPHHAGLAWWGGTPLEAQDRVATILTAARKALGGEDKIAGMKTLTAEGPFRRSMGPRDMEGTMVLTIARPDKLRRVEEMAIGGMVGGPMIERTSVLNGATAWDDTQNRGGMGGGIQMVIRDGPGPGAPGGPGGPAGGPTPEQLNEARVRRMKVQLQRWLALFAAEGPQTWVDAGVAESPDGKADILEAKEDTGRMLRLFIDQNTHLPLMIQYQDPKPMVMVNGPGGPGGPAVRGGPGGPPPPPGGGVEVRREGGPPMSQEDMQKRIEEMRKNPPPLGTYAMHLSEFKKVDGVMLPHKIGISLDGQPNEEWTVEKYKVNPSIKASDWEKK